MRRRRSARRHLYQALGFSHRDAERAVRIERGYRARIRNQLGDASATAIYPVECGGRIVLAIPNRLLNADQREMLEADPKWSFALIG